MLMKLLIATHNPAKLQDIKNSIFDLDIEFLSLKDINLTTKVKETGKTYQVEGKIRGVIAQKPYKTYKKGFPFDALLYFPDKKKYYYQLKYEDKPPVNHRTKAIQKLKPILKSLIK